MLTSVRDIGTGTSDTTINMENNRRSLMVKRAITCPMKCHEDFLEREYDEAYTSPETWWPVTRYICRKCEWGGRVETEEER